MATTNVQAFSGDVEVAKSLYVDSDTLFVDSAQNRVSIGSTTVDGGSFSVVGSNGLYTQLYNAGAAADNRRWFFELNDTQYINSIANDDNDTASIWMVVARTGTTVNSITFPSGNIGINTTTPATGCKLDIHGVLVGRSTAETSQLYIMPGGEGGGVNSNEYSPGNPHMGTIQVISEQTSNDEFSSMCVINKDRDNNTTKNASIGFFTTDTSGAGKYVGKIGFWPEDGNSVQGQFRIYTGGGNAGYNFPTFKMVVKADGNVGIGLTNPGVELEIQATTPKMRLTDDRLNTATAGLELGAIEWYSRESSLGNDYGPVAKMAVHVANTTTAPDGRIRFSTGINGVLTERVTITDGGNFGIGTMSPSTKLHVNFTLVARGNANTAHGGSALTYNFPVDGMYLLTFGQIGFYDSNIARTYLFNKTSFNGPYYSTLAGSSSYISISTTQSSVTFTIVNLPSNYNDFGIYVHLLGGDGY